MTQQQRPAELRHHRLCKLIERVGDDRDLESVSRPIEKFDRARQRLQRIRSRPGSSPVESDAPPRMPSRSRIRSSYTGTSRVVLRNASIPVRSATPIQISGIRTPSRSRHSTSITVPHRCTRNLSPTEKSAAMVDEAFVVVSIEVQSIFGARGTLLTSRSTSTDRARHGHPVDRNQRTRESCRAHGGSGDCGCIRALRLGPDRDFVQRCRRRRADRHRNEDPPDVRVFSLDTGRLHPETYRFIERVREHYNMRIEMLLPDAQDVQDLVSRKGLFSFYRDGHQECCSIRKIKPLRRHLAAWMLGSPASVATRASRASKCRLSRTIAAFLDGRSPHRQIQSARGVDVGRRLGLHPRERRPLQPAARRGIHEHRLRAVHASGRSSRARTQRALVVGGCGRQRVRPARPECARGQIRRVVVRADAACVTSHDQPQDHLRQKNPCRTDSRVANAATSKNA